MKTKLRLFWITLHNCSHIVYEGGGFVRGVAYWAQGNESRILCSIGSNLYALDAKSGRPIQSFGQNGAVDLRDSLDWNRPGLPYVISNSPGIIYKNLIIMGTRVSENYDAAPGSISAYDVISGDLVWSFHTIPHPGEFGFETWPKDAYLRTGGANNWCGMSLDSERGIVFVPTGSASFDFYGGDRLLPAGGFATPSTYMIDGKQYVVIAAGGGKLGLKSGDTYVAFAISED